MAPRQADARGVGGRGSRAWVLNPAAGDESFAARGDSSVPERRLSRGRFFQFGALRPSLVREKSRVTSRQSAAQIAMLTKTLTSESSGPKAPPVQRTEP